MNADGSNQIQLTSSTRGGFNPAWSPDGTKIAFASIGTGIDVMNADGSNRTTLVEGGVWVLDSPSWSPDGTKIAFTSGDSFSNQIVVMNTDGSARKQFDGYNDYGPVWSPDGTKIAFTRLLDDSFRSADIYVINADGSNPINLTSHPDSGSPAWQPLPTVSNPIDDAQTFVRWQYRDFLNREPDADGLSFWTNQITSCGSDAQCIEVKRINVSAAFFLSIEFQQSGYLVYRFYKASFGNLPNSPVAIKLSEFLPDAQQIGQGVIVGQTGWETVLENNKQTFASQFVQRARFASAYPTSLTPAQFVDALFANAGVVPSSTDRGAAINEFGVASTTADVAARARALRRVAENSILAQQEFNRAFVLMQYFGYLRRNPNDPPEPTLDFQGYNFWLNKLNSSKGDFVNAEMVKAFITSIEYRHRFGP